VAIINASKQALALEGDFVEFGVSRGGNAIAALMIFERYRADRRVWLFDTFLPAKDDGLLAQLFANDRGSDVPQREQVSAGDVRFNFRKAGVSMAKVRLVEAELDLALAEPLPDKVSLLCISDDDYRNTLMLLKTFYPRLSIGGSLILEDGGRGSRRAFDEYFANLPRPLLHHVDATGRAGVKVVESPATGLAAFSASFRLRSQR
jgi:O-methyltransferase